MEVGQMAHHCQLPLNVLLGKSNLKKKFFPLASLFKKSLYNDKPWRQNLPTAAEFKVVGKKDFLEEKKILEGLINEFHSKKKPNTMGATSYFWKIYPSTMGANAVQAFGPSFKAVWGLI